MRWAVHSWDVGAGKSRVSKSAPASQLGNGQGSLPDARDTASETQTEGAAHVSARE